MRSATFDLFISIEKRRRTKNQGRLLRLLVQASVHEWMHPSRENFIDDLIKNANVFARPIPTAAKVLYSGEDTIQLDPVRS